MATYTIATKRSWLSYKITTTETVNQLNNRSSLKVAVAAVVSTETTHNTYTNTITLGVGENSYTHTIEPPHTYAKGTTTLFTKTYTIPHDIYGSGSVVITLNARDTGAVTVKDYSTTLNLTKINRASTFTMEPQYRGDKYIPVITPKATGNLSHKIYIGDTFINNVISGYSFPYTIDEDTVFTLHTLIDGVDIGSSTATAVVKPFPLGKIESLTNNVLNGRYTDFVLSNTLPQLGYQVNYYVNGTLFRVPVKDATLLVSLIQGKKTNPFPVDFKLITFYQGAEIGSTTKTLNVYAEESMIVPSILIDLIDINGYYDTYGGFVEGLSKVRVSASAIGKFGDIPEFIRLAYNGNNYYTNGVVVNEFVDMGMSGSATYRSFGKEYSQNFPEETIFPYFKPSATNYTISRNEETDTNVDVAFNYTIASIGNQNSKTVKYYANGVLVKTETLESYDGAHTAVLENLTADTIHEIKVEVIDDISLFSFGETIYPTFTLINFNASGDALAVGHVSENTGCFDSYLPFNGKDGIMEYDVPLEQKYQKKITYREYESASAVSVPTGTSSATKVAEVSLPDNGTYLVFITVRFAINATGYRIIRLCSSNSWSNYIHTGLNCVVSAVTGGQTFAKTCGIVSGVNKLYILAEQNSGASLDATASYSYMKIA